MSVASSPGAGRSGAGPEAPTGPAVGVLQPGRSEGPPLASAAHRVADYEAAVAYCAARGWTDGLPVVPPTAERIWAMLAAAGRDPGDIVGQVPARRRTITAEKVAINAVMAGCDPIHFPVVLAAVEAMLDPAFNVHGPTASTSGVGILVIVNGPVAAAARFNARENLFGPGPASHANLVVGRAVRLVVMNALGSVPGGLDRACFGHPGKLAYCIAEDEAAIAGTPGWPPLAQERGVPAGLSAVTVFAGEAPHQVAAPRAAAPEPLLLAIADVMSSAGRVNVTGSGEFVVVIAAEHRRILTAAGWSKADVRRFLHERAGRSVADLKRLGRLPGPVEPGDERRVLPAAGSPDDIHLVAAGGHVGAYSVVIPGWTGTEHCRAVTRPVGVCLECQV
ncbi:MAG TPA: hypothetical protein VNM66_08920 [Thermodesulfobacteriota bacterium]|nr:hypothetical protein [Thermodesulfobacteriota bacterium]